MLAEVVLRDAKKQTRLSHQTVDFETHLTASFETNEIEINYTTLGELG